MENSPQTKLITASITAAERTAKITQFLHKLNFPAAKQQILLMALTHPTFFEGAKPATPEDNQRLEFLGDAVLDMLVSEYLYQAYPQAREGDLSKMRAALVCEASLAAQAQNLELGQLLRLGKGSEVGGDRERPSILADAFEALVGAIYVGLGHQAARDFINKCFAPAMDHLTRADFEDKKSLLQELTQKEIGRSVTYKLLKMDGPDHAPHFESGAYCGGLLLGQGQGGNKKESEQAAAAAALASKNTWLKTLVKKIAP